MQKLKTVLKRLLVSPPVLRYWFFWARLLLRIRRPLIIGVTGSAGKTTTVGMLGAVLAQPAARERIGPSAHTVRNMNDDDGVPLTVLRYDRWLKPPEALAALLMLPFRTLALALSPGYPKVLVIEFGTHHEGHLHWLVRVAPPDIGVVTTIGPAHLDHLKTIQGVVHEKSAVVRTVPPTGLVVLGADHDHVAELEALAKCPVVKVPGRGAELSREIARTVARHLGVPEQAIDAGLDAFQPVKGRLNQLRLGPWTVIDDHVNANPLSMRLALDTLAEVAQPGQRRVALIGSMLELGTETVRYHRELGAHARERADVVIGVGELARHYTPDRWFATSTECADHLDDVLKPGDCVLVKGSRSIQMNLVVDRMRERPTEAGAGELAAAAAR